MTAEVTLYRCYWPTAFAYLKAREVEAFAAKAYDLLMTLEVAEDHACGLAARLPVGAIIDVVSLSPQPVQDSDIDTCLFRGKEASAKFDKN